MASQLIAQFGSAENTDRVWRDGARQTHFRLVHAGKSRVGLSDRVARNEAAGFVTQRSTCERK